MSEHKKIKDMTKEELKELKKSYNLTYANNNKIYCNVCDKNYPAQYIETHKKTNNHMWAQRLKMEKAKVKKLKKTKEN